MTLVAARVLPLALAFLVIEGAWAGFWLLTLAGSGLSPGQIWPRYAEDLVTPVWLYLVHRHQGQGLILALPALPPLAWALVRGRGAFGLGLLGFGWLYLASLLIEVFSA